MTEKYEQTGETTVEHARTNKIRGICSCYEIGVSRETYDSLTTFVKSRSTLAMSFDAVLEGYTELFSLYRFVNEEKTRTNLFIHTDKNGYEEMININQFGKDNHINCFTVEGHSYSFYPVDDLKKQEVGWLIGHIQSRMIKLANILDDRDDQDNKVIIELAYEYIKEVYKNYK